ncbi:MAG: D-amino-acid dehydrogenase [Gammaproteobacteria bacterium]|jgi:D-amino-acid dehydrogenase
MRVVVIGAGLMGLLTAYFLNKRGVEVTVIDRQDSSGRETSFANGAMLHASQASPWNAPGVLRKVLRSIGNEDSALLIRFRELPRLLRWGMEFVSNSDQQRYTRNLLRNARLAGYSLRVMQDLRNVEELNYDFAAQGTMTIYSGQRELDISASNHAANSSGDAPFEVLDSRGAAQLEPALSRIADRIVGAIYYPRDESGDAFKFCQCLQRICQSNGVKFGFGIRVTKLTRSGGEVTAVNTNSRQYSADKFVLAAGSYSTILSRSAGLRVPVRPVKGYSITTPIGTWTKPPTIPVIDDKFHAAVCPLGDRLRVAGTAEFAGFDTTLTGSRIDNLIRLLTSTYPDFEPHFDLSITDRWAGLRPMTSTGVPLLGRTSITNLYLNTGHGHLGWTMAAGSSLAVAQEIVDGQSEFDLDDYRLLAP